MASFSLFFEMKRLSLLFAFFQLVLSVQLQQWKEPGGELRSSPFIKIRMRWRLDTSTMEATTELRLTHCGKSGEC